MRVEPDSNLLSGEKHLLKQAELRYQHLPYMWPEDLENALCTVFSGGAPRKIATRLLLHRQEA